MIEEWRGGREEGREGGWKIGEGRWGIGRTRAFNCSAFWGGNGHVKPLSCATETETSVHDWGRSKVQRGGLGVGLRKGTAFGVGLRYVCFFSEVVIFMTMWKPGYTFVLCIPTVGECTEADYRDK